MWLALLLLAKGSSPTFDASCADLHIARPRPNELTRYNAALFLNLWLRTGCTDPPFPCALLEGERSGVVGGIPTCVPLSSPSFGTAPCDQVR